MPDITPDPTPKTPVIEGDYDQERMTRLVENLRAELAGVKADAATSKAALQVREDAEKSDADKLTDRIAKADKAAADARRELLVERAVRKHNLPDDVVEFLTGDDADAIEAKAVRLAALSGGTKTPEGDPAPVVDEGLPKVPEPVLTPGHGSGSDGGVAFDAKAIAAAVRNR